MLRRTRVTLLGLAALLVSAFSGYAQSDLGSIEGVVKDPSSSTVPNATVKVKNQNGLERSTKTNESGFYVVTSIPPGIYSVTVEAPGFKKFESVSNKLDSSSKLGVDATLTVGAASETVEVTASATQLQTESATVQKLVA